MPHAMTEDYPLEDAPRQGSDTYAAAASSNCACDATIGSSTAKAPRASSSPAKMGSDPIICSANPKRI